jgi:hypothetical protein
MAKLPHITSWNEDYPPTPEEYKPIPVLSLIEALPAEISDNRDGKIIVRLQMTQLNPDATMYKVFSPQFEAPVDQPIQVQVEILKRYVKVQKDDGTIVLSAMGLARIAKIITTALAKIYEQDD